MTTREGKLQIVKDRGSADDHYRLLFESIPVPIVIFDQETSQLLAATQATAGFYQRPRGDLLALRMDDLLDSGESMSKLDGGLTQDLTFKGRPARLLVPPLPGAPVFPDRNRRQELFSEEIQALAELGSWVLDCGPSYRLRSSKEAARIFGIPHSDDPEPEMVFERIHAEDRARVMRAIDRSFASGKAYDIEYRLLRPGNEIRWVHARANRVQGNGRGLDRLVGIVSDVTVNKIIERERDVFFRVSSDMQCIGTLNGHFKRINPSFEKVLGWSEPDLQEEPVTDFVHPDDKAATLNVLQDLCQGISTTFFENRFRCRDGSYKWLSWAWSADVATGVLYASARDLSEHKRQQATLAESEALHRRIVETAYQGIWIVDDSRRTTFVNPRMAEKLGYTPRELLGRSPYDLIDPASQRRLEKRYSAWPQGAAEQLRIGFRKKDGSLLNLLAAASPLSESGGVSQGTLVMLADLTDGTEEVLRRSEGRFRALAEYSADVVSLHDATGLIVYAGPSLTHQLGYAVDEFVGRRLDEFSHPDERDENRRIFEQIAANPADHFDDCVRVRHQDGSWRWMRRTFTNLLKDANVEGVILNQHNVTEQRAAEEALKRTERRFRALVEHGREGTQLVAADGIISYVSPPYERLFGRSAAETVGKQMLEFVHEEDRERLSSQWQECLKKPGGLVRGEARFVHADGRHCQIEATQVNCLDNPDLAAVVIYYQDVSDKNQLEQQMRQLQKMEAIGQLAGGIAHDFNNILTVIVGSTALLLEQLAPDNEIALELVEIKRAAARAAALTQQLLAFSRMQVLIPKVLALDAVIAGLQPMLQRLVGVHIQLSTSFESQLGCVKVDPGQIEQVIVNLAVNARDAMPDGGRLTIETKNLDLDETYAASHVPVKPGRYVMFSVGDTGCGMDAETQRRVFEPFFTTKPKGKGTGLGLPTSYGIVKQSGGYIWFYSEPGHGTVFKVYLPRVDEAAEQVPRTGAEVSSVGSERILLIDDDPMVLKATRDILVRKGYNVLPVSGGEQAEATIADHIGGIDLVVTDVMMPGISGDTVISHLRELRPDLKVLFMSGFSNDRLRLEEFKGADFIQKPFTPEALASKVRACLDATDPAAAALELALHDEPMLAPKQAPKGHILLVDDEPAILRVYSRALSQVGYLVKSVANGRAALELLKSWDFDLVICDIAMPDMNGLEILKAVHQHDSDIPVMLMTGAPTLNTALKALDCGALRYLMKPIEPKALQLAADDAVRLRQIAKLKCEALKVFHRATSSNLEIERRFEAALGSLFMAYQPIVCWSQRRLLGYEALVRTAEPGLTTPQPLFQVAEQLERVHDAGDAIRRRIAARMPQIPKGVDVFVNLHTLDLLDESFFQASSPLRPYANRLVFEIAERSSLDRVADVRARVATLRQQGYRIAIDDLGAGYGGLSSFAHLVPEVVKIDMSLVRDVDRDLTKQKLIRSMNTLCLDMGLLVIMEGVETVPERDTLIELGCDYFQGYLFGRPNEDLREPTFDGPRAV